MSRIDELSAGRSDDTPAWAQRLAQRRNKAHDIALAAETGDEDWTPQAVETLWAILDTAVDHANTAFDRFGSGDHIDSRRTEREYRLSMMGTGGEREITVFASLCLVDGRPSGGAQISTSETRAEIHLVPSVDTGGADWVVSPTGAHFTERTVGDLFLSVFSDDPAATKRLSPLYTVRP